MDNLPADRDYNQPELSKRAGLPKSARCQTTVNDRDGYLHKRTQEVGRTLEETRQGVGDQTLEESWLGSMLAKL